MRLLNIHDLSFQIFEGEQTLPPYAIASHCWLDEETTYLNVLTETDTGSPGYKKVDAFCEFIKWRNHTLRDLDSPKFRKIDWMWIDSCCIDKRNSTEVGENIISMYEYYQNAEECYAYLSDVHAMSLTPECRDEIQRSRWFTRGWTLQELLAPSTVYFLSAGWNILGHKCSKSHALACQCELDKGPVNGILAKITNIPLNVINNQQDPRNMVPGDICRWVRRRRTRRVEDLAYCLLGLLGVYMLPQYGEKAHAWVRLEEEVAKQLQREFTIRRPDQLAFGMPFNYAIKIIGGGDIPKSLDKASECGNDNYVKNLIARHHNWVAFQRSVELRHRIEDKPPGTRWGGSGSGSGGMGYSFPPLAPASTENENEEVSTASGSNEQAQTKKISGGDESRRAGSCSSYSNGGPSLRSVRSSVYDGPISKLSVGDSEFILDEASTYRIPLDGDEDDTQKIAQLVHHLKQASKEQLRTVLNNLRQHDETNGSNLHVRVVAHLWRAVQLEEMREPERRGWNRDDGVQLESKRVEALLHIAGLDPDSVTLNL